MYIELYRYMITYIYIYIYYMNMISVYVSPTVLTHGWYMLIYTVDESIMNRQVFSPTEVFLRLPPSRVRISDWSGWTGRTCRRDTAWRKQWQEWKTHFFPGKRWTTDVMYKLWIFHDFPLCNFLPFFFWSVAINGREISKQHVQQNSDCFR